MDRDPLGVVVFGVIVLACCVGAYYAIHWLIGVVT